MPAKGSRVAHQAVRQALSQMPAQLAEAVRSGRVLGHCHGPIDHFPTIHSDKVPYRTMRQQAEGGAPRPSGPRRGSIPALPATGPSMVVVPPL